MGCGSTCGCAYLKQGLALVEPMVRVAEMVDNGTYPFNELDEIDWKISQFYLSERAAYKTKMEEDQRRIAEMMGDSSRPGDRPRPRPRGKK